MSKQRFRRGDKLKGSALQKIEDDNRRNRAIPSAGMLLKSGPDGTALTPMSRPGTTGTGVGTGQAWAKLTADHGDGTYSWVSSIPIGPPDYWSDGLAQATVAVEANLCAGLPIPSHVPCTFDGSGRPRFQMELCV